ncbi:Clp protease ClpB [Bacillus sp. HMF5848]|uniref:Clp protease ClpB n=1 Tax=Bacillus sp. HMF5848 TaxID=2495421 RepID=UPI000F7AD4D3|nr:Clp protease ClpB [Bacillus sp. HMF5848]RSK25977.1 Clp protease ClpB [Bacillus sp. HMF5848]
MKQVTYLISAIILGLSLVISAYIFSTAFSKTSNGVNNIQTTTNCIPELMTKTQLSEYLQISEESISNIIVIDDAEKANRSSFETYRYIPYLKIDGQVRFLKPEIDKWLYYKNSHQ